MWLIDFTHIRAIHDLNDGTDEPKGVLFDFSIAGLYSCRRLSSSGCFALTKIKLSHNFLGTHTGVGGRAGSVEKGWAVGEVKLGQKIFRGGATA